MAPSVPFLGRIHRPTQPYCGKAEIRIREWAGKAHGTPGSLGQLQGPP